MPRPKVAKPRRGPISPKLITSSRAASATPTAMTTTKRRQTVAKKFTLFPKLPLEIRRMIWNFALPGSRVIEVLWSEESKKFYTDALQPVLLQVCTESRRETLRAYESFEMGMKVPYSGLVPLLVDDEHLVQFSSLKAPFGTYIDWKQDTLYCCASHMPTYASVHFLECLRQNSRIATKLGSLAISPSVLSRGDAPGAGILMMAGLLSMRNLKAIRFLSVPGVADDSCQAEGVHCNLLKGHRRALCIDAAYKRSVKMLASVIQLPLELFRMAFGTAFSIVKTTGLLPDYGTETDHELVLPNFEWNLLCREDATRYRTGPYGTNRKRW